MTLTGFAAFSKRAGEATALFAGLLKTIFRSRVARSPTPEIDAGGASDAAFQTAARHFEARDLVQAEALASEVVRVDPDYANAWNLLGAIALADDRCETGIRHFERAIALQPQNAEFHGNCGEACRRAGWLDDAIEHCRAAVLSDPAYAGAFYNLGVSLLAAGEVELARDALQDALALEPGSISPRSSLLFALCHLEKGDGKKILAEHQRWNEFHAQMFRPAQPPQPWSFGVAGKLRVGFVSADFRQHSLAYFIEPLFAHYDRQRFEFFCYSNTLKTDEVTARLRAQVADWHDITALPDDSAAALVAADKIDVLIDLSGHTARSRLLMFARKPAPVQITYVGYPNTTGLTAMDYRISDNFMDPPGVSDAMYTETVLRMPNSLWCYRPPAFAPGVNPLPLLANGFATFGSPHSIAKINQSVIDLWAKVLARVPGSRLLMAGVPEGNTRLRLLEKFHRLGIEAVRIELLGKLNVDDYFKFYHRVDVVLDAFPYAGGTTTCESLWMGVPVISLAGEFGVSRAGVSLLSGAQMPEYVAVGATQFVAIAEGLSKDAQVLAGIRANLRNRLQRSSLMDEAGFTRAFEKLLISVCPTGAGPH